MNATSGDQGGAAGAGAGSAFRGREFPERFPSSRRERAALAKSTSTSTTRTSLSPRWSRALMRPASTSGAMEETFPGNSRPRNAGARTSAGCPTLISPKSRFIEFGAHAQRGDVADQQQRLDGGGRRQFAGLALTCKTVPAIGARTVNLSMPACARRSSARATLSWPSFRSAAACSCHPPGCAARTGAA